MNCEPSCPVVREHVYCVTRVEEPVQEHRDFFSAYFSDPWLIGPGSKRHEMTKSDSFDDQMQICHFDEVDPDQLKAQLGINDIKSIIKDCNLDFIETQSCRAASTDSMIDCISYNGEDMDIEDDMQDIYEFEPFVFRVPDPKVPRIKPNDDQALTPTSVMLVASMSSVTSTKPL